MQYNYDFHFNHQLVDASQMLEELESFYYNRNVDNGSFSLPLIYHIIDSQIS